MTSSAPDAAAGGGSRNLILTAMIFAVVAVFGLRRGVQAESDPTGVA